MHVSTYDTRQTADQLTGLATAMIRSASGRSRGETQHIIEGGVESEIARLLDRLGGYSCDFVASDADYPATYTGLLPIREQIELVAGAFGLARGPALKVVDAGLPELPPWMEGWAAIPIEWLLDRHASYAERLETALYWMNASVGHKGYIAGSWGHHGLDPFEHVCPEYQAHDYGRDSLDTKHRDFLAQFHTKYGSKIAILPVQMGRMRRGQSDRMARALCRRTKHEFPATSFEVASLLAMHPGRIGGRGVLSANCPGDVFALSAWRKLFAHQMERLQMIEFRGDLCSGLISLVFGLEGVKQKTNAPVTFSTWHLP